jgi:hypothetical protein
MAIKDPLIDVDLEINAKSYFLDPDPKVISDPDYQIRGLESFLLRFEPRHVLVTGSTAYWLFNTVPSAKDRISKLYEFHGPLLPYADEKDPSWDFRDRIENNPDKKQMLVSGTDPNAVKDSLFPELEKPHKAAIILVGLSKYDNIHKMQIYARAFNKLPKDHGFFLWIINLAYITTREREQLSKLSNPDERVQLALQIINTI